MPLSTVRPAGSAFPGPPMHGYRGDLPPGRTTAPRGLTAAVSREAGARGTTIARKLGELLGWQVFDQEVIDYLLVDETGRNQLLADVPEGSRAWVEGRFAQLVRERRVNADADTEALVRLILGLAARGDAVIVGRGAGFLLPADSTLHVRVVAPFDARVNYLAQSLRLTREEAAAEVRHRDERRSGFLARVLASETADLTAYDVVVNSARLGVEGAAQFIGWAVRTKQQFVELATSGGTPEFDDSMGA